MESYYPKPESTTNYPPAHNLREVDSVSPGSAKVARAPTHIFHLLLILAGDIESNPGPHNTYTRPTCSQNIPHTNKTSSPTENNITSRNTQQHKNMSPNIHRTHNINILQHNIDGLKSGHAQLKQYMHQNNIHIAIIQETKLTSKHTTPTISEYTPIRQDRQTGGGGGLITYIHKTISYIDTTQHTKTLIPPGDTTMEVQSIRVSTGTTKHINLINIYIPPNTPGYTPNIEQITQMPHTLIGGDFNAWHTSWYIKHIENTRGESIAKQLNNMHILNDIQQHTRIPYQANFNITSPDITFCSPTLAQDTYWRTDKKLQSDHLPIIITTRTRHKPETQRRTYVNYNKANWTQFSKETEEHFEHWNKSNITNIDTAIKQFNTIINNADKHSIPRGNRKIANPNFTPEIKNLIKQRDNIKHNSIFPHTPETVQEIQTLNSEIDKQIQEQQTQKWNTFVSTLNHNTNATKLYKTLNSITRSSINTVTSHAAITSDGCIPTDIEQANILINHYSNISHLAHTKQDKQTKKRKRKIPLDHTAAPFTAKQTKHIINNIRNTPSTGPDNISNMHLKHLGTHGIQALTNISNYSHAHCKIPSIWKRGTIITILKPQKDPTLATSYRPITLLCTPSKITERLTLDIAEKHIELSHTQHGFRPLHSTNTLLTNLTQNVLDGMNSNKPERTLLITIDISKAFDAIPRFILTDKIYNTNMPNNTKRWLANYLADRRSHVTFKGKSSLTRNFPNGVPQGSVLSPTLFNLYMHDMPTHPTPNINTASYADDITITSTDRDKKKAAQNVQPYLNTLQQWFNKNRLKIAPAKSTVTLLTSHTKEHKHIPKLTLGNTKIPHTNKTKILGVTYDTSMSFKDHILDIKNRCTPRLNALRALSGTRFGQHKETTTIVYKQYIRSVMEYAGSAWAPNLSKSQHKTLQTIQNKALRIITGCTQTAPIDHVHHETKVLKLHEHLDMRGAQFFDAASENTKHPCHHMKLHPRIQRYIKKTPQIYYQQTLDTIQPIMGNHKKHIHTEITKRAIQNLQHNTILGTQPPEINTSETTLSRQDRVDLARMRSGHHPSLRVYQRRLDESKSDTCPDCNTMQHNIKHVIEECPNHITLRTKHNIHKVEDMWRCPVQAAAYLGDVGLCGQPG